MMTHPLDACGCGRAHDQSASCIAVAAAARRAAAVIAADADLASRCAPLLAARADLAFHEDAVLGVLETDTGAIARATAYMLLARRALRAAMDDMRCTVAAEHVLWDGLDPADVPLATVDAMTRDHRDQLRCAA